MRSNKVVERNVADAPSLTTDVRQHQSEDAISYCVLLFDHADLHGRDGNKSCA